MNRNKRPTLADVAREAGVSTATVSRLIQDTGPVSRERKERIERAMATLGYAPRQAARQTTTGMVALLLGDLINPFFPEIVRGVQDEVDNYGMILTLYNLTDHSQRQQQLLQRLSRQAVDGVIVAGSTPFPELLAWRERNNIPMVLINRRVCQAGVHCILVDFENAVYRATQYLLSLNHTRIGHLASPGTGEIAQARLQGLETALAEAGLTMRPEWCPAVPLGAEIEGGFRAMSRLLDLPSEDRPTAVIAFNDVFALGALHAVRVRGLSVPQDISIIGVDDIFASAYAAPPLTTIGQPKYRMGAMAVQVLRQMAQEHAHLGGTYTILESPLIVRESTGPAPVNNASR